MATIVYIGAYEPKDDNEIPDNTNPAWRIHQGATDYIVVDTSDDEESVDLVSSGTGTVGIGSGFTTPHELLHIANSGTEVGDDAYIKFTTEAGGHGAGDGAHIGLNKTGTFQIAMDDANDILLMQGAAPKLTVNSAGNVALAAGLNVANTGTLGTDGVAIGAGCTAAGANAISVGHNAISSNTKALALGNGANASSSGSIAMGPSCQGAATNSVAIGTNSARTEGAYSMALGYFSQTKRPFEQTFTSATYGVDKKASSQRKFVSGQCQTTDDTVATMLDAENAGSTAMLVNTTNCQTTDKSSTTFFNVRVVSTVTGGDEDSDFEIGEFLARSYTFAIKWVYDASTPTISMISDSAGTAIASDATIYAARENVRASNAVISHATNGIVDSITLVADPGDQAGRGAWKFRVQSANDGATIRHSCFVDQVDHILA